MRSRLNSDLLDQLMRKEPLLWLNPNKGQDLPADAPTIDQIAGATRRLELCQELLPHLFPGDGAQRLESPLQRAEPLRPELLRSSGADAWFLKRDDALPIAGSIKARGAFHEVLDLAEALGRQAGLWTALPAPEAIVGPEAKRLFGQHHIAVGSTGNLGLGIGVIATALGFRVTVHMSADAKAWKKERLRSRGVQVVEHSGSYSEAVAAGRAQAGTDSMCHFVDDEHSLMLFLGYAAAARPLAAQLVAADRIVDADHPLFVYIPCGVGGAPGGITHGLKALFGDHVHCFFAEPVASPCMLVQLASGSEAPLSVYDIGLDNRTEADGLAVGQASLLVSPLMISHLSGVFTVSDRQLFELLRHVKRTTDIDLEPSAAAAVGGPAWLSSSPEGRRYCKNLNLEAATHVIWTTGGSLVPAEEHRRFQSRDLDDLMV